MGRDRVAMRRWRVAERAARAEAVATLSQGAGVRDGTSRLACAR